MGELYTRELIDDWLEYKQDKCIRSDEMDDMIDCTIKLLRSYITSHKTIAERDAEIKKQADYIASCKRDGAYWWREASGLGTKNVNLQAQLAERDAEIEQLQAQLKNCSAACKDAEHARNWHYQQYKKIEMKLQAHEKREAALEMQVARLEQSVSDMSSDYHRAFNENMAYLAFVEAFDVWVGVDIINSDAELDKVIEAREQLRRVIDDN